VCPRHVLGLHSPGVKTCLFVALAESSLSGDFDARAGLRYFFFFREELLEVLPEGHPGEEWFDVPPIQAFSRARAASVQTVGHVVGSGRTAGRNHC